MQPSTFKPHPLADLFPLIQGQEFEDLVADIEQHGVREPITVTPDGLILDGRNRWRAAQEAEVECPFAVTELAPAEWPAFVVSLNIQRRHMSESDRGMVAAQLANMGVGRPRDNAPNLGSFLPDEISAPPPITIQQAADMLNVGRGTVEAARVVIREAVPEIKEAVRAGSLSVSGAALIAKQPTEEQQRIAKLKEAEIKAKVSELREAKKRHDDKVATLPTKAEALEISKRDKVMVRANDGEMHLYVPPEQTAQYDVWLEMKPVVFALSEPKHTAEAFAASADGFWRPKFGAHLDAAIAYLTNVKQHLEKINGQAKDAA